MATVLVIGSTGKVGRVVVDEALQRGRTVRAQTRSARRARRSLPDGRGGATFYDVVRAVVDALGDDTAHISLMTTMNASHSSRNTGYEFVEWKRRAERLVRASGHPYTVVRPGWFDYRGPADRQIDLRQGDLVTGQRTRHRRGNACRAGAGGRHLRRHLPAGTRRRARRVQAHLQLCGLPGGERLSRG